MTNTFSVSAVKRYDDIWANSSGVSWDGGSLPNCSSAFSSGISSKIPRERSIAELEPETNVTISPQIKETITSFFIIPPERSKFSAKRTNTFHLALAVTEK
jgi:hypothetical protein